MPLKSKERDDGMVPIMRSLSLMEALLEDMEQSPSLPVRVLEDGCCAPMATVACVAKAFGRDRM